MVALAEQLYPEKESGYWQEYFKTLPRNLIVPEKIADKLISIFKDWGCNVDVCEEEKTETMEIDLGQFERGEVEPTHFESTTPEEDVEEADVSTGIETEDRVVELSDRGVDEVKSADSRETAPGEEASAENDGRYVSIPYWDNWTEHGFFTSLWGTWSGVLFKPDLFFMNLPEPSVLNLLFFYLLFSGISVSSNMIFLAIFFGGTGITPLYYVLEFLILVGNFFLSALALHFSIYIFGKPEGFKRTLQIVAYTSAANIFLIIPVVGMVITYFYKMVLYITGIVHGHKFSVSGAVASVLFPIFALIFFILIVILLIMILLGGTDVQKNIELWNNLGAYVPFLF